MFLLNYRFVYYKEKADTKNGLDTEERWGTRVVVNVGSSSYFTILIEAE